MEQWSLMKHLATVVILLFVCHLVAPEDDPLNRQKRGFRLNSASRVAHGYGKRGYSSGLESSQFSPLTSGQLENLPEYISESDGSIMTVNQLIKLMRTHSNLARALVKKFVDINGDDVITTDELFRPIME